MVVAVHARASGDAARSGDAMGASSASGGAAPAGGRVEIAAPETMSIEEARARLGERARRLRERSRRWHEERQAAPDVRHPDDGPETPPGEWPGLPAAAGLPDWVPPPPDAPGGDIARQAAAQAADGVAGEE